MEVAVIYFGLVRENNIAISSIQKKIIEPNRIDGISITTIASLNLIDLVDNPRSGERAVPIRDMDALGLQADHFILSRQDDRAIDDYLSMSKRHRDLNGDGWRSARNLLHQLVSLRKAWIFQEKILRKKFDAFLFLRPDLCYLDQINILDLHKHLSRPESILLPAWHSWGGLNDRFALASPGAAQYYAQRLDMLDEYCSHHVLQGETFLAWALARGKCAIGELPVRAARVRSTGVVKDENFSETRLSLASEPSYFSFVPWRSLTVEGQSDESRGANAANGQAKVNYPQVLDRYMVGGCERLAPLAGLHYQEFLRGLHRKLGAARYLEIGTQTGASLSHALGPAVAIDPAFLLDVNAWKAKPGINLFPMTSDDYFISNDPRQTLGGPIDLAFIDGMHLSEFVLRDFLHVERHCSRDGIIVLHDAVPQNFEMTERIRRTTMRRDKGLAQAWTGDVWRVVPMLQRLRLDLDIQVLDCPPTGLVVIRRLDPASTVLAEHVAEVTKEFVETEPSETDFWKYIENLRLVDSRTWT